jgi:sarcosine oxidase subunit alpha
LSRETDANRWVDIVVDGKTIRALRGESLAAALVAEGFMTLRHTLKTGSPRGMYCGMGTCFECLVKVNGQPGVRACMTMVEAGLEVETSHGER